MIVRPDPTNPAHRIQLTPRVTQPINIVDGLIIREIIEPTSPKCGGKRITIFCNRISRQDIRVRFFQKSGEDVIWENWGTGLNVRSHSGISLMTPAYVHKDQQNINQVVNVFVQLVRPSDDVRSAPITFQYIPDVNNIEVVMMKKYSKIDGSKTLFERLA